LSGERFLFFIIFLTFSKGIQKAYLKTENYLNWIFSENRKILHHLDNLPDFSYHPAKDRNISEVENE